MGSVQLASRKAKTTAPVRANIVADPPLLSAPTANKLSREARGKALLSAYSEALLTRLREMHCTTELSSPLRANLLLQVKLH